MDFIKLHAGSILVLYLFHIFLMNIVPLNYKSVKVIILNK